MEENAELLDAAKRAKEEHQDISSMSALKRLVKQNKHERSRQPLDKTPPASNGGSSRSDRGGSTRTRLLAAPFRKEMSVVLNDLRLSGEVKEAVSRLSAFPVPPSQQAEELCNMLVCMVQEGSEAARKLYFEMAADLVTECQWKSKAVTDGLRKFLEDACPDLQCKLPKLTEIIWEELHPVLSPLAKSCA